MFPTIFSFHPKLCFWNAFVRNMSLYSFSLITSFLKPHCKFLIPNYTIIRDNHLIHEDDTLIILKFCIKYSVLTKHNISSRDFTFIIMNHNSIRAATV